jgi:DHA1 family bicyclomycin/chloramphenicol resistance-like MFS transporter
MARGLKNLTALLALISTIGPYTIDAFFPSLRAMAIDFGVSNFQAQQLLTSYMVPYAVMSLVHGSLSDALGRRRVILGGLALYTLASLSCMLAPTFATLLLARAFQGAVGGVGHIIGRAIVRDCYSGAQAQRVMSTISMLFSLGPALAPVIGGYVHVWIGWRAVFGTMVIFGALLFWLMWWRLPETHPVDKRVPMHIGDIARSTFGVLRSAAFLRLTGSSSLCFVALHVYIGSAPAIVLDHWHLNETSFAALSIPIVGGFALGAFISGRLAGFMQAEHQLNLGYNVAVLFAACMLAVQLLVAVPPVWLQQALLMLMAIGMQLMFPVMTLRILDLYPEARGAASSANSFFSLILSACVMGFLAPWLAESMSRLAMMSFAVSAAGWLLWQWAKRHERTAVQSVAKA